MLVMYSAAVSYSAATLKALRTNAAKIGTRAMMPGDILTPARRATMLADMGAIVADDGSFTLPADVAAVRVRHVASLSGKLRKGEAVSDREACGTDAAICPALAAAGATPEAVYAARVRNTEAQRSGTMPCPHCLIPLYLRDAAGDADNAGAYDSDAHAVRDAAGRLKVS